MGINWNARQDGTNHPRRLRGNSSARLVSSARRLHVTEWNLYLLYLLGMALQRNMCSITKLGKTRPLASITRAQETVQTRATQHALYRFVAGSQSRGMCAFCRPGTGTTLLPILSFWDDATQRRNRTGATDEVIVPLG
ncbi:hypothetical protein DPMN_057992 [Dreissena polymorpha]|uniref:Uncharacterized protein n=1 Tax=Dreissena polymorpha TaxID=45954 RepID=A0A9D4C0X5_DREPO|nr:hypothetical protein DPMN_057992 [Dreissena polymorpha]